MNFSTCPNRDKPGGYDAYAETSLPEFAFTDAATAPAGKFFWQYCTQCHGPEKSKGKVTLHDFSFEKFYAGKIEDVGEGIGGGGRRGHAAG